MILCSNCFIDPEIISIIRSIGTIGKCPTCGSDNTYLYDTEMDSTLELHFELLCSIYTSDLNLPLGFSDINKTTVASEFTNNWKIFRSTEEDKVLEIILAICKERTKNYPEFFANSIAIAELEDDDYLFSHSLLRKNTWDDFVSSVTRKNRYHTSLINLEVLSKYCDYIRKPHPKGSLFYRGRISEGNAGLAIVEMGAPPPEKAKAGRANSEGISCLYLASDIETTVHEVRAGAYDIISVGVFELQQDIEVVDFKRMNLISPFSIDEVDLLQHAINRPHIAKLNAEMGKVLRRTDSLLDYIPTQYITDFIKSLKNSSDNNKYDGVEYNSTMNSTGYNLAIYNPGLFTCLGVDTYSVVNLKYDYTLKR